MTRTIFFAAYLACLLISYNTSAQAILNGDLENIDHKNNMPFGWQRFTNTPNYEIKLDSIVINHGKYSVSIESKPGHGKFGDITRILPYSFKGARLVLKGFMKTENVVGTAGFWMSVDGTRAYDNMSNQNIHGTSDWKEYTISLPYDQENATGINVGGLLQGSGKIWIDNIRLYLDDKLLENQKIEIEKALIDTGFSKNSGINNLTLNKQMVQNLVLLGQVWGFVKYYHPAVAKGDFNMDAELFRIMPAVIKAQNIKDAGNAIEQWINKLGVPIVCSDCKLDVGEDVAHQPDYGEIFDRTIISASLYDKLSTILNARHNKENYYIGLTANENNPNFKHEKPYADMAYPDAGYRLLCLFRYWNMIQYFFPDKHLIGENWNIVLAKYIPEFSNAKNATDYKLATLALIANIHDTHANIWSGAPELDSYRGKYITPFQARFVENKLVVTDYYEDTLGVRNKFKVGDVITTINGVNVDELIKKFLPVSAASNYATQLRGLPVDYLLRSNDPHFVFDITRNGKQITDNINGIKYKADYHATWYNPDPRGYYLLNDQVAYLYPAQYHNKDLADIKKMFINTKGIIIDMRCYPSDFMPFTFVPFIKKGDAPFVKFTFGSVDRPGLFTIQPPLSTKGTNEYKGKVVVIVNEETQSSAEYTTMAFQSSPNVTVIGGTTAGADGDVSSIILPGGISTLISGIGVLYPEGTETQRKGVKIDEVVKPTIAGIKAGRDELLERAVAIIKGD